MFEGKRIILGSNSPRRRELLAGLDIEFTVDTANDFKEELKPGIAPEEVPLRMAEGKSGGFHRPLEENEILLTADTLVLCRGKLLGKPHGPEEAAAMLRLLSDAWHSVLTGVCLRSVSRTHSFSERTEVHFEKLSEGEIRYYIEKYRPYDKAGAYGIQEWIGYAGIDRIEGSYFNIVGLPVRKVYAALKTFAG